MRFHPIPRRVRIYTSDTGCPRDLPRGSCLAVFTALAAWLMGTGQVTDCSADGSAWLSGCQLTLLWTSPPVLELECPRATLHSSLTPEISFWDGRVSVGGRGTRLSSLQKGPALMEWYAAQRLQELTAFL